MPDSDTVPSLTPSRESFRLLVEQVKDYAIFLLDPSGVVTSWNAGAERLKGFRANEIIGKHFSVFYPETDKRAGKPEQALRNAAKRGSSVDEGWRVRKDGTQFYAHVVITAIHDEAGALTGFGKVTRDASAPEALRRQTERLDALEDVNKRALLEALLLQSPQGIIVSDPTGKLVFQNQAAEKIWAGSATAKDIEGWGNYRAFHPDGTPYKPGDWSMARCLTAKATVAAEEYSIQKFDGSLGTLLGSCAPILSPDGTLLGAVMIFADITALRPPR